MFRRTGLLCALATLSTMSQAVEVAKPAKDIYAASLSIILDAGGVPSFHDSELLLIKTDPMRVATNAETADCGSMFGFAYTADKRTKIDAVYQVRIKPITDDSSDVTVTATLTGFMDVNEGSPFFINKTRNTATVLTCKSVGTLEANFIEQLSAPVVK